MLNRISHLKLKGRQIMNAAQKRDKVASDRASHDPSQPTTRRNVLVCGAAGVASVALTGAVSRPSPAHAQETAQNQASPYSLRIDLAHQEASVRGSAIRTNGDEERYPNHIANFSKALPHDDLGEVDGAAYAALRRALSSGDSALFDAIPMGGDTLRLTSPQASLAYQMEGAEASTLRLSPPPQFASITEAGDFLEVYWRALARDVPFANYADNPLIDQATGDLQRFPDYRGLSPATIFRGEFPGDRTGPFISQFLTLDIPYIVTTIPQRYRTAQPGVDHMTDYRSWLAIQRGRGPIADIAFDPQRRYIRSGRDLAEWLHHDVPVQGWQSATLILLSYGAEALDQNNPYVSNPSQIGFVTFGAPAVLDLVSRAAIAGMKAAWYQKWQVHRRLRPEVFAGRLHNHLTNRKRYPIASSVESSPALQVAFDRSRSYLLPMAYPEGSPTHPSYPGGHASASGACATVLKAFFDESFVIPNPMVASPDGRSLVDYRGANLTVGGEINKLASNIALGRDFGGVHWRTDELAGLKLGEQVAIRILNDVKALCNERFTGFSLTKFDGERITI